MNAEILLNDVAPSIRSSTSEIAEQVGLFKSMSGIYAILDGLPDVVLILNTNRQIVFANKTAQSLLREDNPMDIYGLRPGELLDCEHACETAYGCGTAQACRTCGAVKAILSALHGALSVQECRVVQKKSRNAFDLRVWSYPLNINNQLFDLFVAYDISNEKRRQALERIFFHDILNTVSGIYSYSEILGEIAGSERQDFEKHINRLSRRLIEEIHSQRDLMKAESNELVMKPQTVNSLKLVTEIAEIYRRHDLAVHKQIVIDGQSHSEDFQTDPVLLSRALGNLVKNALEASAEDQTVTVGCQRMGNDMEFWVHNETFIIPEIQLQIFQRSFSTKGSGRGLGTYSVRLLTERYLKGGVGFSSTEEEGTRFKVTIPVKFGG
ncbi:MAG TPA: PAS domain-containing sensor histidine kinase [Dehalococcoidales bacterium]|nr:PAS domain-containing sensor histidine kinase [Dehalococcoidales bacterium]